jgi:hypothetical protein
MTRITTDKGKIREKTESRLVFRQDGLMDVQDGEDRKRETGFSREPRKPQGR